MYVTPIEAAVGIRLADLPGLDSAGPRGVQQVVDGGLDLRFRFLQMAYLFFHRRRIVLPGVGQQAAGILRISLAEALEFPKLPIDDG